MAAAYGTSRPVQLQHPEDLYSLAAVVDQRSLARGYGRLVLLACEPAVKIPLRIGNELRILQQIDRGQRKRLGRNHHAVLPNAHSG